ncbi:hypothetical protein D3C71_1858840 [compost metagenome]
MVIDGDKAFGVIVASSRRIIDGQVILPDSFHGYRMRPVRVLVKAEIIWPVALQIRF